MTATAERPERVLNYGAGPPDDGRSRRTDACPGCGGERWELGTGVPAFYCDECGKATVGPNFDKPERQEALSLFGSDDGGVTIQPDDSPPLDEGQYDPERDE